MRLFGKRKTERIDTRSSGFDLDSMIVDDDMGDGDGYSKQQFEKKGARGPILNVLKGAGSGMKTTVTNPNIIRQKVLQALPGEARYITDALDSTAGNVRKLYVDTTRELKPVVGQLAKTIDKLVPAEARIAKKVSTAAVNFFSEKRYDTTYSKEEAENSAIEQALGGIFQAQSIQQGAERNYDKAEQHIKDGIDKKRFEDNMTVSVGMANAVTRLATYTETINQAFQKKNLELAYRSYFLQNDMFKHMQEYDKAMKIQGDAIVRNTGLPEFEKLNMSERFSDRLKTKTFDAFLNGALFNGVNNVINTGFKNIGLKVGRFTSSLKEALEQGNMLGDLMADQLENDRQMEEIGETGGPKGVLGMLSSFGGEWLMGQLLNLSAEQAKEEIDKSPKMLNKIFKAINVAISPNNAIRELEKNETLNTWVDRGGTGGAMAKFFKSLLGNFRPDAVDTEFQTAGSTSLADIKQPAVFDNRTWRTINDVIPAYLAAMLYEAQFNNQVTVTMGAASGANERLSLAKGFLEAMSSDSAREDKTMVYDFTSERLIGGATRTNNIQAFFKKHIAMTSPSHSIDHLAKVIVGDGTWDAMNKEQKSEIRNTLLNTMVANSGNTSLQNILETNALDQEGLSAFASGALKPLFEEAIKEGNASKATPILTALKEAKRNFLFPLQHIQGAMDAYGTPSVARALGSTVDYDESLGTASLNIGEITKMRYEQVDAGTGPVMSNISTTDNKKLGLLKLFSTSVFKLLQKVAEKETKLPQVKKALLMTTGARGKANSLTEQMSHLAHDKIVFMTSWAEKTLPSIPTSLTWATFDAAFKEQLELAPSDIHKKNKITDIDFSALDAMRRTPVKSYHFKTAKTGIDASQNVTGPMAQDVNKTMGDDAAPGGTTLDLLNMNGIAMQAIKELDANVIAKQTAEDAWGVLMVHQQKRTNKLLSILAHQNRVVSTASAVELGEKGIEIEGSRYYKAVKNVLGSASDLAFMAGRDAVRGAVGTTRFVKNEILVPGADKLNKFYNWLKPQVSKAATWAGDKLSTGASKAFEIADDLVTNKLPKAANWVLGKVEAGKKRVVNWYNFSQDLYVKHKPDVPALKKEILRMGGYFIQETGEVITSIRDIAGTVVDKAGNVILYVSDYKDGFFDSKGKLIKEWVMNKWSRLREGLAVGFETGRDLLKGGWDLLAKAVSPDGLISRVLGGIGNFVGGTLGIGGSTGRIYNVLLDIRDILRRGRKVVELRSDIDESKDSERKSKYAGTLKSLQSYFVREEAEEEKKQEEQAAKSQTSVQDKVDTVIAKVDAATEGRFSEALGAVGNKLDTATGGMMGKLKSRKAGFLSSVKRRSNMLLDRISGRDIAAGGFSLRNASDLDIALRSVAGYVDYTGQAINPSTKTPYGGVVGDMLNYRSKKPTNNLGTYMPTHAGTIAKEAALKAGMSVPHSILGKMSFHIPEDAPGVNPLAQAWTSLTGAANSKDKAAQASVSPTIPVPGVTEAEKQKNLTFYWDKLTRFFRPSKNDKNKDGKRDGNADEVRANKEMIDDLISGKRSVGDVATAFKNKVSDSVGAMMSVLGHKAITTGIGATLGTLAGGPIGGALGGILGLLGLKGAKSLGQGAVALAKFATKRTTIAGLRGIAMASMLTGGPMGWLVGAGAGALSMAGAVLTSPATIPMALVAGAGAAVYYGNKYYKESKRKWHLFRFAQYGFSGFGNDLQYHDRLKSLEKLILEKHLAQDAKGLQVASNINASEVMALMGVDQSSTREINDFHAWFHRRFKPFFLNFYTAMKSFDLENEDRIDLMMPERILRFKDAVMFPNGPYSHKASPFPAKPSLPDNRQHAMDLLEYLISRSLTIAYSRNSRMDDMQKEMKNAREFNAKAQLSAPGVAPYRFSDQQVRTDMRQSAETIAAITSRLEAYRVKYGYEGEEQTDVESEPTDSFSADKSARLNAAPRSSIPKASGSLMSPEQGLQYVTVSHPDAINKLFPEFRNLVLGMAKEYYQLYGVKLKINQGHRTEAQQKIQYDKAKAEGNKGGAARPGYSMHEMGLAVDIDRGIVAKLEESGLMRKYGLTRPVAKEPWHIEPAGIYKYTPRGIRELIGSGNNMDLLTSLIRSGIGKGGGGIGSNYSYVGNKGERNPILAQKYMMAGNNYVPGINHIPAKDGGLGTMTGHTEARKHAKEIEMGIRSEGSVDGNPYARQPVAMPQTKLSLDKKAVVDTIKKFANDNQLSEDDEAFLIGLSNKESTLNPNTIGAGGAKPTGLTQMTPETAKWLMSVPKYRDMLAGYGVTANYNLLDPRTSLAFAMVYQRQIMDERHEELRGMVITPGLKAMLHMLGAGGSRVYLQAIKQGKYTTAIDKILPDSVIDTKHNKPLFYNKEQNRWKTLGELMRDVDQKVTVHGSLAYDTKLPQATKPLPVVPSIANSPVLNKAIAPPPVIQKPGLKVPTLSDILKEQEKKLQDDLSKSVVGDGFMPVSKQSLTAIEPPKIVSDIHDTLKSSLEVQRASLAQDEKLLSAMVAFIEHFDPEKAKSIAGQKPSKLATPRSRVAPPTSGPVIDLNRSSKRTMV